MSSVAPLPPPPQPMRIAVIGANLLGCATTLDLALVQEHDERVFPSAPSFQVTVFEKTSRLGGNSLKSVQVDDELRVEVGTYRTLPLYPGSFLSDLVDVANAKLGTFGILGRHFRIPGTPYAPRGKRNALPLTFPWKTGSYRRVVRSFGAWDWKADAYHMIHAGFPVLDLVHRLLNNAIWRSAALALLVWALKQLNGQTGMVNRATALVQVVLMLGLFIYSPRGVVAAWQSQYSFWASTLPSLFNYGITPAISRGSSIGFLKHLADINQKNVATCSISVSSLVNRGGLEAYIRGSGDDYVRKFKYDRAFVDRFIAPVIATHYGGKKLTEISSLAAHFAMLDADYSNSDVTKKFAQGAPDNATLCSALINAAKDTMNVNVKLERKVTEVIYDEDEEKYRIVCEGEEEMFDGVVLCVSPQLDEMMIDTPLGTSISELLGYAKDAEVLKEYEEQEAAYLASPEGEGVEEMDATVEASSCSHVAVVEGVAKASFFRFTAEKAIPDFVQITFAPGVSQFERIREVDDEEPGIYRVVCGAEFEQGVFKEMFEQEASILHFEQMGKKAYSHNPIPMNRDIEGCMPYVVLGNRFVYAAATDKLAKHPEMDAISAVNAASLFSQAVKWSTEEDKDDNEEEEEGQ